jgi:hypothetical protein
VALSGAFAGIIERRRPLRVATRRQIAAILRAVNPVLPEAGAADAAAIIAHVLRIVPTLAREEEESGQPLIAEARKLLDAYMERLLER